VTSPYPFRALVCLLVAASCADRSAEKAAPVPPTVVVVTLQPEDVALTVDTVGTIDGQVNAEIRARVPGYVREQVYRDGSFVKQGELLFLIDPLLTQAAVTGALGAAAASRAALEKAELDVKRLEPLAARGIASQQDLDNARAARQLAQANVLSAQGSLDSASANLSYTRIVAPIAGLAGLAKVRVGSLVGQGEPTLLTTVSQLDPVRVSFSVTEQLYLSNPRKYQPTPDGGLNTLELFLADGSRYPRTGALSFIDRQVDPSTGTFTAQATFANPEGLLRPGQYAKVRDVREVRRGALVIPQRAVTELQGSQQVLVVGADDKAEVRPVALGERVGNRWLVESGLKAGERLVVEGLQKARAGQLVAPRPLEEAKPAVSSATRADGSAAPRSE
jgi:membrane fusion protein, multidrug efflux system